MASIFKHKTQWRVQIRRKGQPAISQIFNTKAEAQRWARKQEHLLDVRKGSPHTSVTIHDLYVEYARASARAGGHTKQWTLRRLDTGLGHLRLGEINRSTLMQYVQTREQEGAGPPTLLVDLSYLLTMVNHGAAVLDADEAAYAATREINKVSATLQHFGRVAPSQRRERRPTEDELERIEEYFWSLPRTSTPFWDITLFAIATAMRLGEIVGPKAITYEDLDEAARTVVIKLRKDPQSPTDAVVPLLSGPLTYKGQTIDPITIIKRQKSYRTRAGRIFPYSIPTIGNCFARACDALRIQDLTFHDLRHDAISRLFEYGLDIPRVALVSGHKSWRNLQRYTHLKPESLSKPPSG